MTCRLVAVCFDAQDPPRLADFWAGLLGRDRSDDSALAAPDESGFALRFVPSEPPKRGQNQAHFDLTSSSLEDQQATVARALGLGARHIDVGQRPDERHVVLADPEGNEFCVIEPGNQFLAGCGFVGALACDGSQDVGYFWAGALDWPLVWDQDQETAIQAPAGGPKISWGGPPFVPGHGRNRLHLEVTPADGELRPEVERLISLGARRLRAATADRAELTDPDGNQFCVTVLA